MSLRNAAPLLPKLPDGTYLAQLNNYTYFEENAAKKTADGYTLEIEIEDRIISERKFGDSVGISIGHLRQQLGDNTHYNPEVITVDGEVIDTSVKNWEKALKAAGVAYNVVKTSTEVFLDKVIAAETKFNIYTETVKAKRRDGTISNQRNINFLPPLEKAPKPELEADDDLA